MRREAALTVDGLTVRRGGRVVIEGISFVLRARDALVVVGRNGTGKSTLLRAMAGLLPHAAGRMSFSGAVADAPFAEHVHAVGHADGLKGALTAAENLHFCAAVLGPGPTPPTGGRVAPAAALARLDVGHLADLPVAYLSAGQRRRVALARLLVAPRPIWLLDEPATALDAAARECLAAVMAEHRAAGGLVVAATHAPLGLDDAMELHLEGVRPSFVPRDAPDLAFAEDGPDEDPA